MDKVFIPRRLMKDIKIKVLDGEWVNGKWVESAISNIEFKGAYFPFISSDIKIFKEGYIEIGDIDLRAKIELETKSIIELNGIMYEVNPNLDYGYLADIKFYILKKVINPVKDNKGSN